MVLKCILRARQIFSNSISKLQPNHVEMIQPNVSCICPHECELFKSTTYLDNGPFNGQRIYLYAIVVSIIHRPSFILHRQSHIFVLKLFCVFFRFCFRNYFKKALKISHHHILTFHLIYGTHPMKILCIVQHKYSGYQTMHIRKTYTAFEWKIKIGLNGKVFLISHFSSYFNSSFAGWNVEWLYINLKLS